jgi:hypothetical protein
MLGRRKSMPFKESAYGRYIIRSWPLGQLWQARAYINERQIGDKQTADDSETAATQLKAYLDSREAQMTAGRGEDGSPSALEYAEAFDRLGKLNVGYEAMLDAHLNAPDYCITATQLAEAAGYENYSGANLHYGKLGQMLAEELNYNPPTRDDGTVIWTATIAGWDDDVDLGKLLRAEERRHDDGHFEWIMRPQVIEALQGRR